MKVKLGKVWHAGRYRRLYFWGGYLRLTNGKKFNADRSYQNATLARQDIINNYRYKCLSTEKEG